MRFQTTLPAALAAAVLALASAAHAGPNLVVNGGFEDLTGLGAPNSFGGYDLAPSTTIPGWTVISLGSGVSLHGPTDPDGLVAAGGDWAISLSSFDGQGGGGIRQDIATEIGRAYRLRFDIGNSPALNGVNFARIGALVGPTLPAFEFNGGGATGNAWRTITYDFVADSEISSLVFGGVGAAYIGLDNVSVGAAVPEPQAWALMLLGFGAMGVAMRWRRGARA